MKPASARDPGAYVVRSTQTTPDGRIVYTLVDMAGTVLHVTLPRDLTLTELADPVLRHAVSTRRQNVRPT